MTTTTQALENMQTAAETMDLALQDLEAIATGERLTDATAEDRLEIIRRAKTLKDLAGFIIDRAETMERTALRE